MGFGQMLAYLRSRSKLTQQELADALGFKSKSTVSQAGYVGSIPIARSNKKEPGNLVLSKVSGLLVFQLWR